MKDSLELKKDKTNAIIKEIKSINDYSKEIKNLLIYFNSAFWKNFLKAFNRPKEKYLKVCLDLRDYVIEYDGIINYIWDK